MSELADRVRSQRQLWAASGSSHDRVIALLRILLPAAIGVLVVLLALAPLTVGRDISFVLSKDRVEVALSGACMGCMMTDMTLAWIQQKLMEALGRYIRVVSAAEALV